MTFDTVVFPFPHLMVLVETVETPWAGGVPTSAAIAPVPVHLEMVWVVEFPVRDVQVTVLGVTAPATPPGMAPAAKAADPATAAQTRRRAGTRRVLLVRRNILIPLEGQLYSAKHSTPLVTLALSQYGRQSIASRGKEPWAITWPPSPTYGDSGRRPSKSQTRWEPSGRLNSRSPHPGAARPPDHFQGHSRSDWSRPWMSRWTPRTWTSLSTFASRPDGRSPR